MKTNKLFTLLLLSIFTLSVFASKKTVTFNAMITNSKSKKEIVKKMKKQPGVSSCKADEKT
jgi:phosphate starvation-inducible membrane PsiE